MIRNILLWEAVLEKNGLGEAAAVCCNDCNDSKNKSDSLGWEVCGLLGLLLIVVDLFKSLNGLAILGENNEQIYTNIKSCVKNDNVRQKLYKPLPVTGRIDGGIRLSGKRVGNGTPAIFLVIKCIATANSSLLRRPDLLMSARSL